MRIGFNQCHKRVAGPVRLVLAFIAITVPLLFTLADRVRGAAGELDLTFGTGGWVVYDFTPRVALARIQRAEVVRAFIESSEYRGRFGLR